MTTDQRFPNIFSTEKALKKIHIPGYPYLWKRKHSTEAVGSKRRLFQYINTLFYACLLQPFSFNAPYQFTSLLNLRSLIFGLAWLAATYSANRLFSDRNITFYSPLSYLRSLFFSGTQSGRKTKTGCTSNCQKNIPQYFDGYLEISFSRTSKFLFSHSAVLVEALTTFCETLVWEHRSRTITASKSHIRPYRMQLQAVHSLSDSASNVFYCYALTRHFTSHNHWPESAKAITGTSDEPQATAHN